MALSQIHRHERVLLQHRRDVFFSLNLTPVNGTAFGTAPAYAAGSEFDKASDGNTATYFDYANASGGYTGIDFGAGQSNQISAIVFTPRAGFESRMTGGVFQGSMDGVSYSTFYTVAEPPLGTTFVWVNPTPAYRYLKYVGPGGSYCNIAEMTFYAPGIGPVSTAPTNLMWSVTGASLNLSWPTDHTGWWLQAQTNGLDPDHWSFVPGSVMTNFVVRPVIGGAPCQVFYRLVFP